MAKMSKAAQKAMSRKISKLRDEGVPQEQAVARAYAYARKRGYSVPEKPSSKASRVLGGTRKKKKRTGRR